MPLIGCGQRRKLSLGNKVQKGCLFLGLGSEMDGKLVEWSVWASRNVSCQICDNV